MQTVADPLPDDPFLPAAVESRFPPLETGQRLSRSILWQWQRRFFEEQGIAAWREDVVPHHITSSAFIAKAYAQILSGFLRDCAAGSDGPFFLVEVGSGSGRLAYLVLRALKSCLDHPALRNVSIRYVMTDICQATLDYWRSHSFFRPLLEEGVLDMARFDPQQDESIRCQVSGQVFGRGGFSNPLVVIANYVFDGIPQDAFHTRDGGLYEGLVTIHSPQKEPDPTDPAILGCALLSFDYQTAPAAYYEEPAWNQILLGYAARLEDAPFLFPVGALQAIHNLERLSRRGMLLLSADRGYSSDDGLNLGQGAPDMARHGSVSMMVDYQMIGEYFQQNGGTALHPERPASSLNVSAFLSGDYTGEHVETLLAYKEAIRSFGPDDFFALKEGIEPLYPAMTVKQLLSFLRLSCWDYRRLLAMLPRLRELAGQINPLQEKAICEAAERVWDNYLPLGEAEDLAFSIGTLLLQIECHGAALDFFRRSVDLYGEEPGTAYNMGVCHHALGQIELALECLGRALGLNPDFEPARKMHAAIEAAVAARSGTGASD